MEDALVAELVLRLNLVPKIIEAQLANPKVDKWLKKMEIGRLKILRRRVTAVFTSEIYCMFHQVRLELYLKGHIYASSCHKDVLRVVGSILVPKYEEEIC